MIGTICSHEAGVVFGQVAGTFTPSLASIASSNAPVSRVRQRFSEPLPQYAFFGQAFTRRPVTRRRSFCASPHQPSKKKEQVRFR